VITKSHQVRGEKHKRKNFKVKSCLTENIQQILVIIKSHQVGANNIELQGQKVAGRRTKITSSQGQKNIKLQDEKVA
jgi:hypothetical protein